MNINEAQKILNKAGYLLEDKYMDDMEDELDSTISFGEIRNSIDKKYKTEIVDDVLRVYPLPEKKNIQFRIEARKGTPGHSKFAVYLTQDASEYSYYIKKSYNYYIAPKNPECHYVGTDKGSMEEYAGAAESILEPAEEALKKMMKPGFFKRLFGKKNVQESYKNEIPDNVMELAEEVLNHSCYDLDWDVYTLAEMGEDWLKDYLRELNDKEMYRACM
jgi:hypothetical protein